MSYKVRLQNDTQITLDKEGYARFEIFVGLDELIDNNLEGVLDILSEEATGSYLLQDINYGVVGAGRSDHEIQMWVTGDPVECLAEGQDKEVESEDGYLFRWDYPGATIEITDPDGNGVDDLQMDDPRYEQYANILLEG